MDSVKKIMDQDVIPSEAFDFDEEKTVTVRQFFSLYKKQFPMMAIITMGYYGDTPFDCYDTYQVFYIHGYTSQPRVVAVDAVEARRQHHEYLSIPVDTPVQFRVVKGHTTVGEVQDLKTVLEENTLPVLVQIVCNKKSRIRVGTDWKTADCYGNLLITKQFEEQFMMIHCLYDRDLSLTLEYVNLMSLTPELTVTPITGFKNGTADDYKAYLQILEEIVNENRKKPGNAKKYDPKKGNPDWGVCYIETKSLATGSGGITSDYAPLVPFEEIFPDTGPPPALPPRNGCANKEDDEDLYDEIKPDFKLDNTSGTTKVILDSSKDNETKKKSTKWSFKSKSSEKEFKHLEKSIKQKQQLKQVVLPGKDGTNAKDVIDTKQTSKAKAVDAKSHDKKTEVEGKSGPASPSGAGNTQEERYVKLARSDQGNGYLKVVHETNELVETHGSHIYSVAQSQFVGQTSGNPTQEENTYTREDVSNMTIGELGESLKALRLAKYVKTFKDHMVDGSIMQELTAEDFTKEFKFSKLEALRLAKFASTGHIPK